MSQILQASVEDDLLERSQEEAERQGKSLDDWVGEALHSYLGHEQPARDEKGTVARTWASIPLEREKVQEILTEEDDFLGA